jgi:pSer/pThr/pTyr-binding forkhead associated (FHA) protein
LNGTYLNQKRVERSAIHNGDELQVGKFRLLFLEGPDDS